MQDDGERKRTRGEEGGGRWEGIGRAAVGSTNSQSQGPGMRSGAGNDGEGATQGEDRQMEAGGETW